MTCEKIGEDPRNVANLLLRDHLGLLYFGVHSLQGFGIESCETICCLLHSFAGRILCSA